MRLAVTQTPVKNHQLTLARKTCKESNNNNNDNNKITSNSSNKNNSISTEYVKAKIDKTQ